VKIMSEDIFGEGGAINELSESVHMGLFLVMLIFLVTVLLLVQFGTEIVSRWQAWEDTILAEAQVRERYHSIHDKTHGAWDFCAGLDHAVLGLEPEEFQEAAYAALRKEFINGPPKLDEHFDFAEYLEPRLGHVLAEFVEIPVSTWIMLEILMVFAWLVIMNTSRPVQAALYLMVGYALPVTLRALHGKVLHIKNDATIMGGQLDDMLHKHKRAISLSRDEQAAPTREEGTPLLALPKEKVASASATDAMVSYGGVTEGDEEPSTSADKAPSLKRRSSQPAKAFASFHTPRRYDPESLIAHYGISGHNPRDHHKRFWFGERYKVCAFLSELFCKALRDTAQFRAFILEFRLLPATVLSQGAFMHSIIRLCLLVNAIYLAIFILMFLPGIFSKEANLSWGSIILLVPLTLLPSVALVNMTSDVVQDYVLVTSIHSMKNKRIIEQADRRMKTRFAFLTLKVIYMMINGTKRDRARSQAGAESGMKIWRAEQAKKKKLRTKFKKGIDAVMAAHKLGLKSATQSPVVDRWDLRTLNLDRSIGE
jgi:hypothetical protein